MASPLLSLGVMCCYPDHERRTTVRVHVEDELLTALVSPHVEMKLLEIGLGGFSVHSPTALPPGTTQTVRFKTQNREAEHFKVLIHRCDGTHGPGYVIGCEFANQARPSVAQAIGRLMDRVTAVLAFE